MQKKYVLSIVAVVGVVAVAGTAGALAYDQVCFDPNAQALRNAKANGGEQNPIVREKLKSLPGLERMEARYCAWRNKSPEEQRKYMEGLKPPPAGPPDGPRKTDAEIDAQHQVGRVRQNEGVQVTADGVTNVPADEHYYTTVRMLHLNLMYMRYRGQLFELAAGFYKYDPSQGVFFASGQDGQTFRRTFPTPTKTGPVKIVSEKNGIVTLESVAGTFQTYDDGGAKDGTVKTPGGTTYTFDLSTMTYR